VFSMVMVGNRAVAEWCFHRRLQTVGA